jgi:hypothetical protein
MEKTPCNLFAQAQKSSCNSTSSASGLWRLSFDDENIDRLPLLSHRCLQQATPASRILFQIITCARPPIFVGTQLIDSVRATPPLPCNGHAEHQHLQLRIGVSEA